jgi:hypothetical protein
MLQPGFWRSENGQMAGTPLPVYVGYLLTADSNDEVRIRTRVAEVERLQGVGGIETI